MIKVCFLALFLVACTASTDPAQAPEPDAHAADAGEIDAAPEAHVYGEYCTDYGLTFVHEDGGATPPGCFPSSVPGYLCCP